MFESLFLGVYFRFYQYYIRVWEYLFTKIKQITFVYYIEGNTKKNITPNYYTGYQINKYKKGKFYTKIYDISGTKHAAFTGNLGQINKLVEHGNSDSSSTSYYRDNIDVEKNVAPKRKQIFLTKNSEPINVDLVILDNYKLVVSKINNPVTNLGEILKLMGIDCTHVVILEMFPFKKTIMAVADVDINELYD